MAEIVEYRVEKTIDELRQLEKIGVFTKNEVRDILYKRQNYEYSLRKRTKGKLDFLRYIQYEVKLLGSVKGFKQDLIKQQKDYVRKEDPSEDEIERKLIKLKTKLTMKVMRSSAQHISNLFRKMTIKYQFDKSLWLAYIEFVKSQKWHERVSSIYWRTLRIHNVDEQLWIQAAKYESDIRKSFDISRKLYLRALKHHPKSLLVWSEYVGMELNYMDLIIQRKQIVIAPDKDEPLKFRLEAEQSDEEEDGVSEDNNSDVEGDEQTKVEESQDNIMKGKLVLLVAEKACDVFRDLTVKQQFLNNMKVKLSMYSHPQVEQLASAIRKFY